MKRIIKDEFKEYKKFISKSNEIIDIPPNSSITHPITLDLVHNKSNTKSMCLLKPEFTKDGVLWYNQNKCINSNNTYKNYLYIPPIGIQSHNLLSIYEIDTIESLQNYIKNNIEISNISTINRLLNCWIRVNFLTIKSHNNFLEKIYRELLERYYGIEYIEKIREKMNIDKEIKNFIDYWCEKNNNTDFILNLLEDLYKHLNLIFKNIKK